MNFTPLNRDDFKKLRSNRGDKDINENILILSCIGFDFSPDVFTKEFGLQPGKTAVRGEKYVAGRNLQTEKVYEHNLWEHERRILSNDFIGAHIAQFIDEVIAPRKSIIMNLTRNCEVHFKIIQYYTSNLNPGICIEPHHTRILADINALTDIDIYCLAE